MFTLSKHPKTIEEVERILQDWLGDMRKDEGGLKLSREPSSSDLCCYFSPNRHDLSFKTSKQMLLLEAKTKPRLKLYLDPFLVSTEFKAEEICLNIQAAPEAEHQFLDRALQEIAGTKHPAFQLRVLRALRTVEECLPDTAIERATAAPTDVLVALEAFTSVPATSSIMFSDPFSAAKLRGFYRKQKMLEVAGGALSSEQVAEILGISRQAVDKRRASKQLLALTQGRRGYSYPSFQFGEGKTVRGLEQVLAELKALDPWMQMVFFTTANERLEGRTPIESLDKGLVEDVVQAASGYGEQGAL